MRGKKATDPSAPKKARSKRKVTAKSPANDASIAAEPRKGVARRKKTERKPALQFHQRLVLFKWLLIKFGVGFSVIGATGTIDDAFERLRRITSEHEGVREDGISRCALALLAARRDQGVRIAGVELQPLSDTEIRRYDAEIVHLAARLAAARRQSLEWKYFQYLALLATEAYLERYLADPEALRHELNLVVKAHNDHEPKDDIAPFEAADLRRLAFWMATGSGKTLLLHANILQFRRHLAAAGKKVNHILLIAPRELLANQHLDELRQSGIHAVRFSREGTLDGRDAVLVTEITKLADTDGKETVAVEAFGSDNLVLIDEGHQGLARGEAGVWKTRRDALCRDGFAFEYSATFGQAVVAASDDGMAREYAKAVLFDYAYKRFYDDGYGKEYSVLNLKEEQTVKLHQRYLVGALMWFYQQLRSYEESAGSFVPFGIDRPLWVCVGARVTRESERELSDVETIVLALQQFVSRRAESVEHLRRLLSGSSGLRDADDRDVFDGLFVADWARGETSETIYDDVLRRVFHAEASGSVHVQERRGSDGELVLRVGASRPFGLIKVGDASKLARRLEEKGLAEGLRRDPPVSVDSPLFDALRRSDNDVHVLIGSRKFTEGWDTSRVSTLGLMNLGRTEGAQVIQLFGRGVRLRGWKGCLKRASALNDPSIPRPPMLEQLETLGVFGLRAEYVASFQDYLKSERVPERSRGHAGNPVGIPVDVEIPETPQLYTLDVPPASAEAARSRSARRIVLAPPNKDNGTDYLTSHKVKLDWYPRLEAERSQRLRPRGARLERHRGDLSAHHVRWLDVDALVAALHRLRSQREWWDLSITHAGVEQLLASASTWSELRAPPEILDFSDFSNVRRWQAIAEALLTEYAVKFYRRVCDGELRREMRYVPILREDANLQLAALPGGGNGWLVTIKPGETEWRSFFERVRTSAEQRVANDHKQPEFEPLPTAWSLWSEHHLYRPLLFSADYRKTDAFKISPVALNRGEVLFVDDLREFAAQRPHWLEGWTLHLLRNQVRRGVRFFEANNFYPDFLLWVTKDATQHLVFVDPKGIRNLKSFSDEKIQLASLIKERERDLQVRGLPGGGIEVRLHSFIVANTRNEAVEWWVETSDDLPTLEAFAAHNVVFQDDERADKRYLSRLLQKVLGSTPPAA